MLGPENATIFHYEKDTLRIVVLRKVTFTGNRSFPIPPIYKIFNMGIK